MSNADISLDTMANSTRPSPPPRRWSKARILGVVLLSLWIAAGIGLIYYLITAYTTAFR